MNTLYRVAGRCPRSPIAVGCGSAEGNDDAVTLGLMALGTLAYFAASRHYWISDTRLVEHWAEGEEMISLRLAVPAVLVAAAVAGCFTYFVTPPPPIEAEGLDTGTRTNINQRPSAGGQATIAFERAAAAILRELPDAQASAGERSIAGHIPLPKKRPIPRTPPDRQ
jgi:hypothetical protein